jgi:protein SCO1/2
MLDVSAYIEQRRVAANKKGYVRSEHQYDIPPVSLVGMDGEKTTLQQELDSDQTVMLNFIFTTCTTICPVLSATFYQLQNELGDESREVRMISISIDPEYDTPDRLKTYAERFNAGPQWRFLTGDRDDILAVEQAFDAFRGAKMNHDPLTFIKGGSSDSWVRITGIASAEEIINEYRQITSR